MTMKLTETVFSPWLTPVRLASTTNVAGTYYNGPNNNGVGATLTIAASTLTIDSVLVRLGDRILLQTQTAPLEQGIYIVEYLGTTVVLQRAFDQQSLGQLKPGEHVAVGAGALEAGNFYTLIEPIPLAIGVQAMVYNSDPASGGVTYSGTPSVVNDFAVFSDTAGNIKDKGFLASNAALTHVVMQSGASVLGDLPKYDDITGTLVDSGLTAASLAALLAASGGGGGAPVGGSVRSATLAGTYATASTVVTDPAITATSVVIARFVSSANPVTIQTVLPAAGQFTVVTDTAPSTGVLEYISFTPSAALLTAGVVVGKGSYGGGSATFVINDVNITAGMVVTTNFESQVTPSKVYTALAGAGTITFVTSANPGVCVIEYAAMLPSDISALGLHAANYSYAGGFASIAISDASITANSIVTAEFKSQAGAQLIQKVTPTAGLLTVLASADPGVSVVAYISTSSASGGAGTNGNLAVFSGSGSTVQQNVPAVNTTTAVGATPGTVRSLTGDMTDTTLLTSGNLVGVRGSSTTVGASGGFLYGVQGKVIDSGVLSGSSWTAPIFAQFDWSAGTLNGGQVGVVWADMGTTSGTATNVTGLRMFAGTNTTAATANAMIYLYGKATNLFELSGSSATYISAGAATPGGDLKKIAITIDGVVHYILAAATWS